MSGKPMPGVCQRGRGAVIRSAARGPRRRTKPWKAVERVLRRAKLRAIAADFRLIGSQQACRQGPTARRRLPG